MKDSIPQKDSREVGLFRFFVKQRVFVNLLFLGVFITGIILWKFFLNREAFGNFDFVVDGKIAGFHPGLYALVINMVIAVTGSYGIERLTNKSTASQSDNNR